MNQLTRINEQQKKFAAIYVFDAVAGGNGTASAVAAGYAADCAAQTAYRLLRLPNVRLEIEKLTREALGDHAVSAAAFLGKVVNDPTAPIRSRVDAAKIILDRAGFAPKEKESPELREKDHTEMSMEEIQAVIRKIDAEIEKAKSEIIDVTPDALDGAPLALSAPSAP